MAPHMTSVVSSNIAAIGYDEEYKELSVRFKTGKVYIYLDVTEEVYDDFLTAPSKGRFFGHEIRGQYSERLM